MDEGFEGVKWSSAATIGEINPNIWLPTTASPTKENNLINNKNNERKILKKNEKEIKNNGKNKMVKKLESTK